MLTRTETEFTQMLTRKLLDSYAFASVEEKPDYPEADRQKELSFLRAFSDHFERNPVDAVRWLADAHYSQPSDEPSETLIHLYEYAETLKAMHRAAFLDAVEGIDWGRIADRVMQPDVFGNRLQRLRDRNFKTHE